MDMLKFDEVTDKIVDIGGQGVIIDSDVARLYRVTTKEINQAVTNNPDKFPQNYIFELTKEEKAEVVKNFDRLVPLKFSTYSPKAFTEKGLYMLATILKGPVAVKTTISIIEAFTKLRALARNIKTLSSVQDRNARKSLMRKSGELMTEILGDGLETSGSETSIELNFAVLKK